MIGQDYLPHLRKAFRPTDEISTVALMAWYAASAEAYGDGDPVPSAIDLSGSGRTATQVDNTYKPTFKTGGANGQPYFQFDGSGDHLTNHSVWTVTNFHVFIVHRVHDPVIFDCFMVWSVVGTAWYNVTNGFGYQFGSPSSLQRFYAKSSGANDLYLDLTAQTNTWKLFDIYFTPTTGGTYSNGVEVATDTFDSVSSRAPTYFVLSTGTAAGVDVSTATRQDVAEILVYSEVKTGASGVSIRENLRTKYGLW
jgi:hypothetical protein